MKHHVNNKLKAFYFIYAIIVLFAGLNSNDWDSDATIFSIHRNLYPVSSNTIDFIDLAFWLVLPILIYKVFYFFRTPTPNEDEK